MRLFLTTVCILLLAGYAGAASVEPILMDGNPFCSDIGCGACSQLEILPAAGIYPVTGGTITVSNMPDLSSFDWSSSGVTVLAVVAKGGATGANVYFYNPPAMDADTNLQAPINPSGKPADLSHLVFCYTPGTQTTPPTTPVPEFPAVALPLMVLVGLLGVILALKR